MSKYSIKETRPSKGKPVYIKRGIKGGRPRYLWVASSQQREALQFVAGVVGSQDGCLIPKAVGTYQNWKQQTYEKLRELSLGRRLPYEFHEGVISVRCTHNGCKLLPDLGND